MSLAFVRPCRGSFVVNSFAAFPLLTLPWFCSVAAAIGLGQALTRILLFSGVLAAEDQRVCSLIRNTVPLAHHQFVQLVGTKITTLTLGEPGR